MEEYHWTAEKKHILELAKTRFIRSNWKTLEDPFSGMITVKCCKEEPELPAAVHKFIIGCNPSNPNDQQFAFQTLEYLTKHHHFNITISGFQFDMIPTTLLKFCKACRKPNPQPLTGDWLHQCKENEWAISSPNQKPTIRWHPGAQCWTYNGSFHNKVEEMLHRDPKNCSFDKKNNLWLIADGIITPTVARIKQWRPDLIFLQNTKRAAPANRAQISHKALFAETILSFLPQTDLKVLTRKVFMNLHPDKGGNHDDFIKFKLALEGWEKENSK